MSGALCKQPIVGGQRTVGVTHYACEVQLTDSWRLDLERVTAQRDELLAELRNIANAKPSTWEEDVRDQFQPWAQNRARSAIAKAEGK